MRRSCAPIMAALAAILAVTVLINRRVAEIRALNEGLETRVAERTTELQAANDELRDFTYSVSHDLRGPLRAMSGFSQILIESNSASLNAEGRSHLQDVMASAQQMGEMIDGL